MIGFIILCIGVSLTFLGKRGLRIILPAVGILLAFVAVRQKVTEIIGREGWLWQSLYVVVSAWAALLVATFSRTIFFVFSLLFTTTVLYELFTRLFSDLNTVVSGMLTVICIVAVLYSLLFGYYSYVMSALFYSVLGACVTLFGYLAITHRTGELNAVIHMQQPAFIVAFALLAAAGMVMQLKLYVMSRVPRSSRIYWGLEAEQL